MSAVATAIYASVSVRRSETAKAREVMANAHRSTRILLDQANDDVERYRTATLAARKAMLRDLTMAQVNALDRIRGAVKRGELTDGEARRIAELMLFDFRYGDNDYFFVFTPEMVSIVEPNPTFSGNMIDYRDPNGKLFFRDFRRLALGPGSGYVDYVGTRAGATAPSPKTSFIYYYEPWKWVIGTGVYLDDIDAEVARRRATTETALSDAFANATFNGEGFLFVLDRQGKVVVAPSGRDLRVLNASAWGKRVTREIVSRTPDESGTIDDFTIDARFRSGDPEKWRFDVSTVGTGEWILVAALPEAELGRAGNRLALHQIVLDVAVLLLGLLAGLLISRRIVRPVQALTDAAVALEEDRFDPVTLDRAAARHDEVGTLARAFRRMGAEVVERERRLREQVTRLTVVVDRAKVDREVGAITDSEFFRNLEERAAELRRDGEEVTE